MKAIVFLFLSVSHFSIGQISDLLTPDVIQKLGTIGAKQQAESAEIFKAYGTYPYTPTTVDPTLTYEVAKKKLDLIMRKGVFRLFGPAYKDYVNESAYYNETTKQAFKKINNIVVTDHYLQFTNEKPALSSDTVTIFFKDILISKVEYYTPWRNGTSCYTKVKDHLFRSSIRELPDVFYYIQQYYAAQYFPNELIAFQKTVDDYNKMSPKPTLTEEQRKYLVQANTLIEKGDFFGAIALYNKALDMNPISFVPAYFNLALIAAMAENYPYAVFCMKKYLMLAPNAEDARSAQDKIYEWEVLIQVK